MKRLRLTLLMVAAFAAAPTARAAEMDVPPSTGPKELSVHVNQPNCLRWTDECVSCTRDANNETPICSNIGVACQPKAIRCLEAEAPKGELPKDEPPKKD